MSPQQRSATDDLTTMDGRPAAAGRGVTGVGTGAAFARALAAKDAGALRALLADPIDFAALTPRRHWLATAPDEVVDGIILGHWFEPSDQIRELATVTTGRVSDCEHVAYRLRVRNQDGDFLVEQQAYFTTTEAGRIGWMRVLCAGYRHDPSSASGPDRPATTAAAG